MFLPSGYAVPLVSAHGGDYNNGGGGGGGGGGWGYSPDLLAVLLEYKEKHSWVWNSLERKGAAAGGEEREGSSSALRLSEMLPEVTTAEERKAMIGALIKW